MGTSLTPASKADLPYQAIRRAIIEQAPVPGTKLPEDQIGTQVGVSRTLVRTGLDRLASEALVDIGNKRSATVSRPSLDGIESRALIAEWRREGISLGDVLSCCRKNLLPPATPPTPTTRRRIA